MSVGVAGSERSDLELRECRRFVSCWRCGGEWECFGVAQVLLLRIMSVEGCGNNEGMKWDGG
jgi:hypothetical protein